MSNAVRDRVCVPSAPQAQAVALTVAQAFTIAFELWQVAKEGESIKGSLARSVGPLAAATASCLVCVFSREGEEGKVWFSWGGQQQFPFREIQQCGEPEGGR